MSNFHARDSRGGNFKTKKLLREAVAAGEKVTFTDTSMINCRGTLPINKLSPTDVIVGPDPYTARNWYANIRLRNGRHAVL